MVSFHKAPSATSSLKIESGERKAFADLESELDLANEAIKDRRNLVQIKTNGSSGGERGCQTTNCRLVRKRDHLWRPTKEK